MSATQQAIERRWGELGPLLDRAGEMDAEQRERLLAGIDDAELHAALARLLEGLQPGGLLDHGCGVHAAALVEPHPGLEGRLLGPWRIGQAIGSGGMACVFAATRDDGTFAQKAAVKVLHHGLHDAWARERFQRERALLARLEHPGIARVLDGGLTGEGVPWFALEFIDGEPVTRHCDARRLDLDARIALFLGLCEAVAHAHRNLVVHRDLKPSNVLVTGDGHFKLLDFGIARLLDDAADATRTGSHWLTPAYAAPEQMRGEAVTTAVDVYALGVLLHELLAGTRPVRRPDGTLRAPSACIPGADAARVAADRAIRPRALRHALRGEADLILGKALAHAPSQRYASVDEFAADVRRWRAGEPVHARAPSAAYRLRKFAGRHRLGLAAAAALVLTLAAGMAATAWQAAAARRQAQRADAVRDFTLSLFEGVTPDESRGRAVSARELLDRGAARLEETLAREPRLRAVLATELAAAYRQLSVYPRAASLAQQAVAAAAPNTAEHVRALVELARTQAAQGNFEPATAHLREALDRAPVALRGPVRLRLAEVLSERGELDPAQALAAEALAEARSRQPADSGAIAQALAVEGGIRFHQGQLDAAASALREALALRRRNLGESHTATARAEHDLGVVVLQQGDPVAAAALFEQALATRQRLLGGEHPDVAETAFNLGAALRRQGQRERAATLVADSVAMQRKLLGDAHPAVANGLNSLALIAYEQGDLEGAIVRLGEALAAARAAYGERHPTVITMLNNRAAMLRRAGRYDEAEAASREALASATAALGAAHYLAGVARLGLAGVLAERGSGRAALAEAASAHGVLAAALGPQHQDTLLAAAALADALRAQGRLDQAHAAARDALAAAPAAFAAGDPRIGKLRLVGARIDVARGACASALPQLEQAAAEMERGGAALQADRAMAFLARAHCLRAMGDRAAAAASRAQAGELARALAVVPPSLDREMARSP